MFKEIFGFFMMVFLLFNSVYFLIFSSEVNNITMTQVLNLGLNIILTGGLLGLTAATIGLDSESISIIVGGVAMSLLLFSMSIGITVGGTFYGFDLGLGLVSTIANRFGSELLGYPYMIVNTLGLITLLSGLMVITGNDD